MAIASKSDKRGKPNILFIMGDDIGWFNISAYNLGLMGCRTPNIDLSTAAEAREHQPQ
jgi:arylsulfatase A-like enzyme